VDFDKQDPAMSAFDCVRNTAAFDVLGICAWRCGSSGVLAKPPLLLLLLHIRRAAAERVELARWCRWCTLV
jgi:hypothetical protein